MVSGYETVEWGQPVNWNHRLNRGLVAWFLAAPGRFMSRSLSWLDLTRQHTGTLTGTSIWLPSGRPGGKLASSFLGGTERVSVPHATRLNLSESSSTVAFWLYASHAQTKDFAAFLDKGLGDSLTTHAWSIRPSDETDDGRIRVTLEDSHATFATGSYPNNQWCHLVVTWDGSNVRLYRNGALIETVAQPSGTYRSSNTSAMSIGAFMANGPTTLTANCRLDDIRLYDSHVLSAGEVAQLYRASVQFNVGLLNRWTLPRSSEQAAGATTSPFYFRQYVMSRGKA